MYTIKTSTFLLLVFSVVLFSCNTPKSQEPYTKNRNWTYAPLNIKYQVPAGWDFLTRHDYRKIKRTTPDSRFLLGIKLGKSFLFLSDYDLIADNCDNKQFVNNMLDTMMRVGTWSIHFPALEPKLKKPVQREIGSYNFTVLEEDYILKRTRKLMMSTLFYIGPTINNHVLVGFTNVGDST